MTALDKHVLFGSIARLFPNCQMNVLVGIQVGKKKPWMAAELGEKGRLWNLCTCLSSQPF